MLGFEATTTLDEMLDEVIPWIEQVRLGVDIAATSSAGQARTTRLACPRSQSIPSQRSQR